MELTDRIKSSKNQSRQALLAIMKVLKCDKSKRIVLAVELLEICSKNGDLNFHRYVATMEFCKQLVKLLERRRGKGFVHNFYNKEQRRRWDKIEELILYLI